jgi:hypothetical protein
MTGFTEPESCRICGHTDKRDLEFRLAHWRVAPPGMAYEHIEACLDRDACRARVAAQGDIWPLVEDPKAKSA